MPTMPDIANTKPLVAVITRTKDRPQLLERAIRSVMNQTLTNFVMVIVNDGGDPADIDRLVSKHSASIKGRIKTIHNKQSLGMQEASNKGIKSVDSTYVIVHDDDDTWHPDFLKKTTEHLEKTGATGVVVPTDLVIEKIEGKTITTLEVSRVFPGLKFINLYRMCMENYAAPISFLYSRSVFQKIGYYDESLRGFGDWDFGLRFLLHYDIEYLNLPDALAFYHQRPDSGGKNKNSVFTDNQQYLENLMTNRYLREDIRQGKMGLGYIINSVRKNHFDNQALQQSIQQNADSQVERIVQKLAENNRELEAVLARYASDQGHVLLRSLPKRAVRKVRRKITRKAT